MVTLSFSAINMSSTSSIFIRILCPSMAYTNLESFGFRSQILGVHMQQMLSSGEESLYKCRSANVMLHPLSPNLAVVCRFSLFDI